MLILKKLRNSKKTNVRFLMFVFKSMNNLFIDYYKRVSLSIHTVLVRQLMRRLTILHIPCQELLHTQTNDLLT